VIHLWEKPINVFTMGNPVADYHFLLFICRHADPIVSNTDLVFSRIPSHLLKVSDIEGVLAYEILKDDLLGLGLDTLFVPLFPGSLYRNPVLSKISKPCGGWLMEGKALAGCQEGE
jgi:hypothetical protein